MELEVKKRLSILLEKNIPRPIEAKQVNLLKQQHKGNSIGMRLQLQKWKIYFKEY
jgi:hypothetical protein